MAQKEIRNVSRRPVSFRANTGQTWHIPPGGSIKVLEGEVHNNAKVAKLMGLSLLAVSDEKKKVKRKEDKEGEEDKEEEAPRVKKSRPSQKGNRGQKRSTKKTSKR